MYWNIINSGEMNQHIEDGKRMLVISFIVAFDFLPEFR